MNIIALDIGGTAVKYGLFFDNKEEFGQFSVYNSVGAEDIQKNLYDFLDNYTPDCIAISVPGPFDFNTGTSEMRHKLTSLYGIGLKKILENKFPETTVLFMHDSASFAYGAMHENPELVKDNFSCVMLGTGIGYVNVVNGVVQLNEKGTPLNPLWNMNYFDGIAEDYVSTKALLAQSEKVGYTFTNVKEMAVSARNGSRDMLDIFRKFGSDLGRCIEIKRKEDSFKKVVFGGQISKSFDLMQSGFETETDVSYTFVRDPSKCALYGLNVYVENFK